MTDKYPQDQDAWEADRIEEENRALREEYQPLVDAGVIDETAVPQWQEASEEDLVWLETADDDAP